MDNDQDRYNLKDLKLQARIDEIAGQIGENPYNRNFIFGGNKDYAIIRNKTFDFVKGGRITILNAMLRYGMNSQKQAHLFPLPHHLGSLKNMPKEKLTLVKLAQIVRKEKGLSDDPHTRKKEFDSITSALTDITGRKFSDYANQQNALRVIYLLDRMMINPKYAQEGREQRILTFLKSSAKPSFEARDAYAIPESTDNTYLLADLKAYLGIEIANETLEKIDAFFYALVDRLRNISHHLDKLAYISIHHDDVLRTYKLLNKFTSSISRPRQENRRNSNNLDHDLYLHLNRLEFHHFVHALKETIEKAKPPSAIRPSGDLVSYILSNITNSKISYTDTTKLPLHLELIPDLLNQHSELFIGLIHHALGFRPSTASYKKSIALSQELIYRTILWSSGTPFHRDEVVADFRLIATSLCAVSQALEFRTDYRPRVFGNDGMSRSIITPLETPVDFHSFVAQDEISEAYFQIWHHRREWVLHAMEGSTDVAELKFDLRRRLSEKVIDIIALDDIDLIESSFDAFENTLLHLERHDLNG